MNSSDLAGSRSWQSASLPGRLAMSSAPLRRVSSRALRAASRAVAASTTLPMISLGLDRVGLEPAGQALGDHVGDDRRDLGADQLVLGLRGELGVGHLDREDAGQALAHVLAGERDLVPLQRAAVLGVLVDAPGSARRESP